MRLGAGCNFRLGGQGDLTEQVTLESRPEESEGLATRTSRKLSR